MKKLILSLIFLSSVIASFGQQGVSGIFYRVQDSTTYRASSGTTTKHSQGYRDIYFNEQATTPHWDIWNGSSYDHVFSFGGGGGAGTVTASDVTNVPSGTISATDVQSALNELDLDKLSIAQPSVTYTSNHTLDLSLDYGKMVVVNTTSGSVTITIPTNAAQAFPVGTQFNFLHIDTGGTPNTLTFVGSGGVTITASNPSLISPLSEAGCVFLYAYKLTTDGWDLANGVASSGGGGLVDGDYGDITVGGIGTTMTIDNLAVTNGKINDVALSKITGTGTGVSTWLATPSWTNFNSAITGTSPYIPLTGSASLTGALNVTGSSSNNFTLTVPSLGVTNSNSFNLINSTAATSGNQQVSPSLYWQGSGFGTTGAASQTVGFRQNILPVQGTTAPSGLYNWEYSINGGAYTTGMQFSTINNSLSIGSSFGVTISGGTRLLSFASNGFLDVAVNGAVLQHRSYTTTGVPSPAIWAFTNQSPFTATTGATVVEMAITGSSYAATSGSSPFVSFRKNNTANLTGSASGAIIYDLTDPTITAGVDVISHKFDPTTPSNATGKVLAHWSTSGGVAYGGSVSPAQITSNQNNYTYTGSLRPFVHRWSSDASRDVTGLVAGIDGDYRTIINVGSFNIVLKDEDTNSTAANRFALNADVTILPDNAVTIWYDAVSSRWRVINQ